MKTNKKIALPFIGWAFMFIVISTVMVFWYAFHLDDGSLSLGNFIRFFSGKSLVTLIKSLRIAFLTTIICLILGYPMAYYISKLNTRYRSTALMMIMIPMWMNFLLRTYAWVTILSKNGILNSIITKLGFSPLDLLYTEGAVVLGMVYNFLPFMVLPIYTILEKLDPSLIEAAKDLGCNPSSAFRKVTLPLSLPGVISGVSMVFIPAISTFEITALLGGNKTNLIGNVIEQQFTVTGDWNYGSSMAVILMIFLVISLIFDKSGDEERSNNKLGKKEKRSKILMGVRKNV